MRDLSNFDKILRNMEAEDFVTNSAHGLLLHRQSFYLSKRFHRNCCVSDNSVCVRGKRKRGQFLYRESSQSSLLSSDPRVRLDYNYQ